MKLINRHKEDLVSLLKKQNPAAQRQFYDQQSRKLLGVCRSYVKDIYHAEDCLVKGFCKIFKNIDSYRGDGNFDGWVRRIIVNECLNFLKTHKTLFYLDENQGSQVYERHDDEITVDFDAQNLLDQLPEPYKLVFNLHIIEDYSHQEISEMLNISVSASKTQLFRAKSKLKEIYLRQNCTKNETR